MKWIFLEDFVGLRNVVTMAVNLDDVATISPRPSQSELVLYFSKAHLDPHVLKFKSSELCQTAYDDLKMTLKYENLKDAAQNNMR